MVAARKYIDLEKFPEIVAAARESRESGEPIDLRIEGKTVAVLSPEVEWKPGDPRKMTPEDLADFMSTAGAWSGLIDAEKFLEDNRRSRNIRTRPEVKLEVPD